jgi:hypothetical protein
MLIAVRLLSCQLTQAILWLPLFKPDASVAQYQEVRRVKDLYWPTRLRGIREFEHLGLIIVL